MNPFGPHAGQPLLRAGAQLDDSTCAVIAIHGRGASADDIIGIERAIDLPKVAWLAPEASSHTWYPYSFLMPVEQNQPFLDSAISVVGGLLQHLEDSGLPSENGGACLDFHKAHAWRPSSSRGIRDGMAAWSFSPADLIGSAIDPLRTADPSKRRRPLVDAVISIRTFRWNDSSIPGRSGGAGREGRFPDLSRNGAHDQYRRAHRGPRSDRWSGVILDTMAPMEECAASEREINIRWCGIVNDRCDSIRLNVAFRSVESDSIHLN